MADFSFWLHLGGRKVWVHGEVVKRATTTAPVFDASSEMFDGYQVTGDYMTLAVGAFREGLKDWLAEHPDQIPRREAIHDC
jgi:hypothetical protein